jgi:hypothetical protein
MRQSPGRDADLAAARLLLDRMGISLEELTSGPAEDRTLPTFAEYVPVVAAAVSPGTRRAYGSYWNKVPEHWGDRRLDEPTPTEIEALRGRIQAGVAAPEPAEAERVAGKPVENSRRDDQTVATRLWFSEQQRDSILGYFVTGADLTAGCVVVLRGGRRLVARLRRRAVGG